MKTYEEGYAEGYVKGYSEGYHFAAKRADTWIAIFSIGAFLLGVFVGMVLVRQVI